MMSSGDTLLISTVESHTPKAEKAPTTIDVDNVKCDCCGLTEECTLAYIERIRERYQGKWICGLCSEAIKDEACRCERLRIDSDQALSRHLSFCKSFQSSMSPPPDPAIHMIAAMRQILRRSLDSPKLRSLPCSPTRTNIRGVNRWGFTRSESCMPSLSLVDDSGDDHAQELT